MRPGIFVLSMAAAAATALGGCCSGDVARREDMVRKRQYELDQREARLGRAEARFKECMAREHPDEDDGLAPPPAAGGGGGGGGPEVGAGGMLTPEQLEEVRQAERAGQPTLIACYQKELARRGNKQLQGKVVVKILIGTDGSASQVQIGESTLKAPAVHRCIIDAIRKWELPRVAQASWYSTTFSFSPAY
jgi:TonB family protein